MAVVVGNQKQLMSLLLLCLVTSAVILPWGEAQVTCDGLVNALSPCSNYIFFGWAIPPPPACCSAMKTVVDGFKTKQERQNACECMKAGAATATPDQLNRAQALPTNCKVPLPFQIGLNVNCSAIPNRI